MTGDIRIDLQMSVADIEAELPGMSDELPRIPIVGNAMGQHGLKGAIAVRALSHPWHRGRFADASVHLAGWRPPRRCVCAFDAGR